MIGVGPSRMNPYRDKVKKNQHVVGLSSLQGVVGLAGLELLP